jgi:soluble epoxide hydrolase / lipid-phosphate phosphatase
MTTITTNEKMSSQQGKSKKEESVRDTSVYSTLNEEYLRHPSNYFITPLRSPIGFPNKKASQRRYFYLDVPVPGGVEEKATILLLHGFPDSSYGWRKIISPLSMSGYRLIIPDLLGYGRTSKPISLEEYSARSMSFDLADLMTHVLQGKYQNKFAVVGHDWGSWLSWKLPLWIPDRLLGVHVSYVPPTQKFISTTQLAAKYPQFGYQMWVF